jgi:Putative 2OG-Fe(II) oxygenase
MVSNIGYFGCQLTPEQLTPILEEVLEIENDFSKAPTMNRALVGNINHQYLLVTSTDHIESIVLQAVEEYNKLHDHITRFKLTAHNSKLKLVEPWVNFMSKGEFNPIHDHTGVMSFVIWLRVPFTAENEYDARPHVPKHINVAGNFAFHYTNSLGRINHEFLPVDKTWEGRMALFPSSMSHSVFPFYSSNDYRISVAGNLYLT